MLQPRETFYKKSEKLICPIMNGTECAGHKCVMAVCSKALCEGMKDIWYCGLITSKQNLRHPIDQTEPEDRTKFL